MIEPRKFPAKILQVIDSKTIVIDRGAEDGVKDGDIYLVYALGEEIIDPDTQENYGKLEIVKGRAIVEHTQEKISTLKSSKTTLPGKRIIYRKSGLNNTLFSLMGANTETKEEINQRGETLPFDNVKIGDLVKPI